MKKLLVLLAAVCLLSGCSWMDGSYLSITPHRNQSAGTQSINVSAANYLQLRTALEDMVTSGTETAVINVAGYRDDLVADGIANAALFAAERFPLGAYAVEEISYEIGTSGGKPAISVNISYIHGRAQIRKIKNAGNMDSAKQLILEAMDECSDSVVVLVSNYNAMDFVQLAEDYAKDTPDTVMEVPRVSVGIYPDAGASRVLEVKFQYETSRESLRQMQQQVRRTFESAQLYINSDAADAQKYAQLYTFLMERFDYDVQTSITPAYSLLSHGVGDCEAFATVYAAMCRQAGLECHAISGTRDGQSWHWNIIRVDGEYYHVDLLRCSEAGGFRKWTNEEMRGYVWDYSAFGNAPITSEEVLPE